jgi:hypothetical protein
VLAPPGVQQTGGPGRTRLEPHVPEHTAHGGQPPETLQGRIEVARVKGVDAEDP